MFSKSLNTVKPVAIHQNSLLVIKHELHNKYKMGILLRYKLCASTILSALQSNKALFQNQDEDISVAIE